ncbi:Protein argonaute 4 -like protein [Gossypium arboreum]|uniref:Protein argonaute 4-like protein n=1 Tax=Gossypium arboreum TaxID=29729 RepID=A0A0B0NPX8_GOSAR|nr:Protein argonaute 4 -like protein [Gossypium arboreum]
MTETDKIDIRNYRLLSMLMLGQTTSIPVVSKVPTIILGMGALFGFPEQSDVPSIVAMGSPDNVLHGTVIDNKVCHPKNNNFYLGTHAGMIGITRQTHYHVLLDQAGFLADDLQYWGQFMKIRDASETSSSHGGMYAPRVISVPQIFRTAAGAIPFSWVCESRFFLQALMESRIEYL